MPRVNGIPPAGFMMAQTRITDQPFWKMVALVRERKYMSPAFYGVDWDSVRNPLDFECFLLGAGWMTLRYADGRPSLLTSDPFSRIVVDLLLATGVSEMALTLPRWWPAFVTDYGSVRGTVFLPAPMLDSSHLGQFIKGAEFMIDYRKNHPSSTWLYAPSLVLCCMAEKPPSQLVTRICDLILPRSRMRSIMQGGWKCANDRTWIRLLSGGDLPSQDDLRWYDKHHHSLSILASPWLAPHVRHHFTRTMKHSDAALVGRLSLPALKTKLRSLKKNKGDDRWLRTLHSGYYILDDEDDEIMAMLPAILNPRWALTAAALLERRSQMLKLLQNVPRSFKKLPHILIDPNAKYKPTA